MLLFDMMGTERVIVAFCILLTVAAAANAKDVCDHVSRIKVIPFEGNAGVDPDYDALIAAGKSAVPCLIRKFANTTPKPDPRQIPRWGGVTTTVGDTALTVLKAITGVDTIKMLPLKYQRLNKEIGVYAEQEYLQSRRNRRRLQQKLRSWYWRSYVPSQRKSAA
jgi:hypothetical protein